MIKRYNIKHFNTMKNGKWKFNEVRITRGDFEELKKEFDKSKEINGIVTYLELGQ